MYLVQVELYSGYRRAERPTSFLFQGKRFLVDEVERSWIEEEADLRAQRRIFVVCTKDGGRYKLSYSESTDTWWLEELLRRRTLSDG